MHYENYPSKVAARKAAFRMWLKEKRDLANAQQEKI